MAARQSADSLLPHLRRWLTRLYARSTPDADLLRRYAKDRDESAFAALMDRHGAMVLGVARRVVGDHQLAEDVFQATFLALARRAGRMRRPGSLPAWLHHTARNLAITAVRATQRRRRAEGVVTTRQSVEPVDELSSRELLAILDEELRRLPEVFRLPLILCCLEGRTQTEAATLLGWTPGSVKGRLERGRQRLKERLTRRGLTFAVGAGVPLLLAPAAVSQTLRAATLQAAHQGAKASPFVSALANGAARPFVFSTWKSALIVVAVGLVGVGLAARSGLLQKSADPAPAPPAAEASERPSAQAVDLENMLPDGAVARLGSTRLRIGNSAFALTADGLTIITVSPEGIVRKFDAKTGRLRGQRQLTDRSDVEPTGQASAKVSADGKTAAILERITADALGLGVRRITVWDLASEKIIFRRATPKDKGLVGYALSPDGKKLAVGEWTGGREPNLTLSVFDLRTGRMKQLGSVEFNLYDIRFTEDGKRVYVSQTSANRMGESTFGCFDVEVGKELWRMPRKGQEFALSPDGKTLVCAESGGRYQIIETDPENGKPSESFKADRAAHPNIRGVIAPDNRTLVMNHFDGLVLWDLRKGEEVRRFALSRAAGRGYGPELGAISADSRTAITNLGYLQRWDLTTGKPFFEAPPDDGLGGPIECLAFTRDGKEVFASGWSLTSGRWDVKTGKQIGPAREKYGRLAISTSGGLRAIKPAGERAWNPTEFTLFDPITGKELNAVSAPEGMGVNGLRAYTLSGNGKTLLVAHGDEPDVKAQRSYVTTRDVATGRRVAHFAVPGSHYFARTPFSPCGRWVVIGGIVYHVASGTPLFTPAGEPGEQLVPSDRDWHGPVWFSSDSRLMAGRVARNGGEATSADTLGVWELASGKLLARFSKTEFVAQVAFAPDGRSIALLDGRGACLYDLLTGKRLAAYAAPDVNCQAIDRGWFTQTLAFAPDGRTLATGHQDGTVLLWKVPHAATERPKAISDAERETLWADLASASPGKARAAVERLACDPAAATALLRERFRPRAIAGDPEISALIDKLDSDVFAVREEATRKLRERGGKAEPALRRALASAPSLDLRRRLEGLLAAIPQPVQRLPVSGETLRGVRAIEVLERAGTSEARKLLQAWAEHVGDERLALEARLALERVEPAK